MNTWISSEFCSAALLEGTFIVETGTGTQAICGVIARNLDGTFDGYLNFETFDAKGPTVKDLKKWRNVSVVNPQ